MRFDRLELYDNQVTGSDELGNDITEPILIGVYQGLVTSWTSEEIALLERDVTKTQRKLMTDAPMYALKQADIIRIGEHDYSFVNMKTYTLRWRLCHVRDYFQ